MADSGAERTLQESAIKAPLLVGARSAQCCFGLESNHARWRTRRSLRLAAIPRRTEPVARISHSRWEESDE